MKVRIEIEVDNDAFVGESDEMRRELRRILMNAAENIAINELRMDLGDCYPLHDYNGNRVGEMTVIEDGGN